MLENHFLVHPLFNESTINNTSYICNCFQLEDNYLLGDPVLGPHIGPGHGLCSVLGPSLSHGLGLYASLVYVLNYLLDYVRINQSD